MSPARDEEVAGEHAGELSVAAAWCRPRTGVCVTTPAVAATSDLRELNARMAVAEQSGDRDFLAAALHDDLVFRRADGSFSTKQSFLAQLDERTYDVLVDDIVDVDEKPGSAVVTAIVTARGTAHGKAFAGTFRNVRAFTRDDAGWQCRLWVNTRLPLDVASIHHASLPVSDVERSARFYKEVLGLQEIARPPFDFPGAWFQVGPNQLHLIVGAHSTFRGEKGVDSRDIHFAVRVRSFSAALEFLQAKGYSTDVPPDDPMHMKVSEHATAGFPQIYILDPDRNVVEINAERLDSADGQ